MIPRLVVEQKITAFANKYLIYAAQADGRKGNLLAFAQQKRLAFKEKVTFYTDETKTQEVFTFRAEKVMDIHGSFYVEDESGRQVGSFKKDFAKSLLSSTWNIQNVQGQPVINIAESNRTLAILRRYGGLVPILGVISEIVTSLLKYHFDFKDIASGNTIGKYQKTTLFRDQYVLSMEESSYSQHDWRVIASVAVALDALQDR